MMHVTLILAPHRSIRIPIAADASFESSKTRDTQQFSEMKYIPEYDQTTIHLSTKSNAECTVIDSICMKEAVQCTIKKSRESEENSIRDRNRMRDKRFIIICVSLRFGGVSYRGRK